MTTFLLPVEGLTVTSPWKVGSVELHPGATLRSLLGDGSERWLGHKVLGDLSAQIAGELERHAVAMVDAADIDAALDLVTLATDLLRVYQRIGATHRTTMFGLPGQLYRSHIRYLTPGEAGGPGFRNRGEAIGWTFDDEARARWLASRTFTSLAVMVSADHPREEGPRRALLGVQLLSQALLEHRPAFKILNLVIALESMLLERSTGPQTLRLLRRATYFTCGRHSSSLCGRDTPACQFLVLNPGCKADRQQLQWLRELAHMGPPWKCSEWLNYEHWYDLRSSVAHGGDEIVSDDDVSRAEYWIFKWTVEPLLEWLIRHPAAPLTELDNALATLGPVPDWQNPVPEPGKYELTGNDTAATFKTAPDEQQPG